MDTTTEGTRHKLTRKTQRNPKSWKKNIRKHLRDAGKSYISSRNKLVPAKQVVSFKDCAVACKFNCGDQLSDERRGIFNHYYSLDKNGKTAFIASTTRAISTKRPDKKIENTRRLKSMEYFFFVGGKSIRVCKPFYLGTLSISQQKVNYIYKNVVSKEKPLKNQKDRLPEEMKENVRQHIRSFPKIESHYCRSTTRKEYLDANLNIQKMYELYEIKCDKDGNEKVRASMYRSIFVNEFNLDFHVPKKDRCDACEEVKTANKNGIVLSQERVLEHETHIIETTQMRNLRNEHRQAKDKLVITFDLENVINVPHAEISSFFYKRKLTLYNLTAHASLGKKGYCAIWTEIMSGRNGNDIASAFKRILREVVKDYPLSTVTFHYSPFYRNLSLFTFLP